MSDCSGLVYENQMLFAQTGMPDLGIHQNNFVKSDLGHRRNAAAYKLRDSFSELIKINENSFGPMIGKSTLLRKAFKRMVKTAFSSANVVIYGESGTGKELAAQTIHNLSARQNKRFVPINCGAIPEELMESEFFGYKKGAFTGAAMNKLGYIDWADQGTLFLDEIGELSPTMQVKLLRAVDGCGYSPIGSQEIKKPDIRIIAATNRNLEEDVRKGQMREDFFYRINVLPIHLPALRDRKEDLPLLVNHFLARFSQGEIKATLPANLMAQYDAYHWPGNIRELQNKIQRYLTLKEIGFLEPLLKEQKSEHPPLPEFNANQDLKSALEAFEKQHIMRCLEVMNWNRKKTCAILKINRKTLYKKMRYYRIERG